MKRTAILIVLGVCLTGCTDKKDDSVEAMAPYEGRSLSLHFPANDELAEFLDPFVEEWNARTGAEARLVPYSSFEPDSFDPGSIVLLSIADSHVLSDQLAIVPNGTPGRDELSWSKLLSGLRNRVVKRSRDPKLVPITCPPIVCYYRKDLLDAAGLQPPKTWLEYNQLVSSIADWATGLQAVEPWHQDSRAMMFLARSIAYASPSDSIGVLFDTDSGKPQIASEGFVRGLEHLQQVAPALAHCWEMNPLQCREALLSGKAAIGIAYEPTTNANMIDRAEDLRLGFCRLPGSNEVFSPSLGEWDNTYLNQPALAGFDGHVVGVIDNDDEIAVKAAYSLVATIIDATTATEGAPLRGFTATWHADVAPGMFEPQLTIDEATEYVTVSIDSLSTSDVVLFMPVPNANEFADVLSNALTVDALAKTSAADLLTSVEAKWSAITDAAGPDFLNAYRRNLGLREKR
ncbi:MAG: hypothetical protein AB8G99_01545 [Planctomycetaceae bacterium]